MTKDSYRKEIEVGKIITDNLDSLSLDQTTAEIMDRIKNFCLTLKRLKPNINLDNLKNNLKTLKVILYFNDDTLDFNGAYDFISNEIHLDYKCIEIAFYHELFHLASSTREGNPRAGFLFNDNKNYLYWGLNEGYTDLLAERYFEEEGYYEIEKDIVFLLEKIITNKKMEELYFSSDSPSIISELENYCNTDDILLFLSEFDYISAFIDEAPFSSYYNIGNFLIKTYIKKENKLLENKLIDYDRFIYDISTFIRYLEKYNILDNLEVKTIMYEATSKKTLDKCLNLSIRM